MAAKKTTQTVEVVGLKESLKAMRGLPKDASRALRAASKEIAGGTARAAISRGVGLGGVQRLAAESVKAGSDRVPRIVSGGAKRLGHRKTPAGAIFFGAEFGGGVRPTTQQFPRHLGQTGYFLWPTIRDRKSQDLAIYHAALRAVCNEWAS